MPEEIQQDVIVDSSPTENSDVIQEVVTPEQTVEDTSTTPDTEPGEAPLTDVDDIGVPWKNRAMEAQRKLEKHAEELAKLNQLLQQQQSQAQPVQKQPTIGELKAFALNPDTSPEHAQWAYDEIHKIEQNEAKSLVEKELNSFRKQQLAEKQKADTFNAVINRNPDLAIKDAAGNFVQWNTKSPLFQKMNQYMANPRIANQPDALDIAEAFAMRDLARATTPQAMQKIVEQKAQISNLQKRTLVEGGVNAPIQNVSPRQVAIDKTKSGNIKDGAVAMKEILKGQGIIKED